MDDKKFVVGMMYYPGDRSYSPIKVLSRTEKSIKVENQCGAVWRMFVKLDHDGTEFVTDSIVPSRWRGAFTYCADDPVGNMGDISSFVAGLVYGGTFEPMTVEDAAHDIQQWKEEGSVEPPAGFTPELYASIWNEIVRREGER